MKRILLVFVFILMCFFWLFGRDIHSKQKIKYTDTTIVKYLDTNIIVYKIEYSPKGMIDNKKAIPLKYYQYIDLINSGQYIIQSRPNALYGKFRIKPQQKFYISKMPGSTHVNTELFVKWSLYALAKKSKVNPYWNRKLIKNLPLLIDTNRIFYDQDGVPLKFYQYFGILFNNTGHVDMVEGEKFIWRFTDLSLKDYPADHSYIPDTAKRVADVYLQLLQADNVLVMKGSRKVYLQRKGKTFLTFPCNLGRNPVGDKHEEGDRRTPEGLYTLSSKSTQGKYGKSYLISYPDSAHMAAAKQKDVLPGNSVMIHGTSAARSKLKDWTNGCIAISNAHMDSLFKYVIPGTPIDIRK